MVGQTVCCLGEEGATVRPTILLKIDDAHQEILFPNDFGGFSNVKIQQKSQLTHVLNQYF